MPVYKRFEEMPVWQAAKQLAVEVYQITKVPAFNRDFALRDQIRRAAISVSSNIAEGCERGWKKEFIQFLYIAKGSIAEVRSQIAVAIDLGYVDAEQAQSLTQTCISISDQLGGLIKSLKSKE